jgi:hypothetical protein
LLRLLTSAYVTHSGHLDTLNQCPLLEVKRTSGRRTQCLLLTQRWGNRPAFLWIAKDLRCCASG